MIRLERVVDALPLGFDAMQAEARGEGHTMLDTLAREWASGANRFDRVGEALFAAYARDNLAGIGGLTQEAATLGALRMRRFYVRAPYRRFGIGRTLATALLAGREAGQPITANAALGSETFWKALGFQPDRHDGHTHILIR
jgi:GNAT superfamily N-acetyltransferase